MKSSKFLFHGSNPWCKSTCNGEGRRLNIKVIGCGSGKGFSFCDARFKSSLHRVCVCSIGKKYDGEITGGCWVRVRHRQIRVSRLYMVR
jgi:hypothetical protein